MSAWNPAWHPRLRDLASPETWTLIERGECADGGPPYSCRKPIDPASRYAVCTTHDQQLRADSGSDYFAK